LFGYVARFYCIPPGFSIAPKTTTVYSDGFVTFYFGRSLFNTVYHEHMTITPTYQERAANHMQTFEKVKQKDAQMVTGGTTMKANIIYPCFSCTKCISGTYRFFVHVFMTTISLQS
jgi:hypothetical protein